MRAAISKHFDDKKLAELKTKYGMVLGVVDQEDFAEVAIDVFGRSIEWEESTDDDAPFFPLKAFVDGENWKIRINDFPDEPMFTLCIEGQPKITFEDMPVKWAVRGGE